MNPAPGPDPSPRQLGGLAAYVLGTGVFAMLAAHDVIDFAWCLAGAVALGAVAGAVALAPPWAGALGGGIAAATALGLTRLWVEAAGSMRLGDFQPRAFLFLAVPAALGLVPGFVAYLWLRRWAGLPPLKPMREPGPKGGAG